MFKRKSVLYTWILSYGLLILMMIAMCVMLGRSAQKQLTKEYKGITQTLQQQTNVSLDNYFSEQEGCAYEISNDYLVTDFVSTADPTGSKYYNLSPIQKSLSVYGLQSGEDVNRYLYMDNIGRALSGDAIYRTQELYTLLGLEGAMAEEDFESLLTSYHYNELVVFDAQQGPVAMMLTSVPLVGGTPKGTLVQVLNLETIGDMTRSNAAVEDSTTALLDEDGSLLSITGDQAVAELLQQADLSAIRDAEIRLGDSMYWICSERLETAEWNLITVVPMSSIREKSEWIIYRAMPIMLVMVLGTAVLCLYFLYVQYRPLNKLRKEMTAALDHNTLGGNEYEQLAAAFTDARSSRDQILALWETQTNELRQEFVQSCMEGDIVYDEKYLHQVLEHLDAGFSGDWFCVAIWDTGSGLENLEEGGERAALEGLLSRTIGQESRRAYLLPRGRQWMVLVNAERDKDVQEAMEQLCAAAQQKARAHNGELLVAVSKPWRDFKNIHLAYLEANEEWRYQSDKALDQTENESAEATPQPIWIPRLSNEQEELLLRYITAGNSQEAQQVLQMILHHNLEKQLLPVSICRCLAYDLFCGILRSLNGMPEILEGQKESIRADMHFLRHAGTREEIAMLLRNTVKRVAEACAGQHETASPGKEQPMDRIMQCVNEHYRDLDFNVSKAAEYLSMSVSHLSTLFKQQTGIGLLNYINGLRVKYAKQCILERHVSVAQAAREAGFENTNTFIRIFKKYEGMTPGSIAGQP